MGGGKTHSLIAFGLLAADPDLRNEVVPLYMARRGVPPRGARCRRRAVLPPALGCMNLLEALPDPPGAPQPIKSYRKLIQPSSPGPKSLRCANKHLGTSGRPGVQPKLPP
jgi:hypothetical protein